MNPAHIIIRQHTRFVTFMDTLPDEQTFTERVDHLEKKREN
jgi:hypothetical protein